jgi:alpha-1,3-rhamnosyl/mannosyltransferase
VKNEIVDYFSVSEKKVSAIHLGADEQFKPRDILACSALNKYNLKYKQYFLFLATIEPRKNIENLLLSFIEYRQKNPDGFPLVLGGGDGWNNGAINSKIRMLLDKGWIYKLGYVPQYDVPILYSGARALLFPSTYEGFGLPVLEAMQSATPVLTTKNTSMSEITENNAVLVDSEDIVGMANAIESLSLDEALLTSLSEKGLKRALEFSWDKCIDETLNVYKSLY